MNSFTADFQRRRTGLCSDFQLISTPARKTEREPTGKHRNAIDSKGEPSREISGTLDKRNGTQQEATGRPKGKTQQTPIQTKGGHSQRQQLLRKTMSNKLNLKGGDKPIGIPWEAKGKKGNMPKEKHPHNPSQTNGEPGQE